MTHSPAPVDLLGLAAGVLLLVAARFKFPLNRTLLSHRFMAIPALFLLTQCSFDTGGLPIETPAATDAGVDEETLPDSGSVSNKQEKCTAEQDCGDQCCPLGTECVGGECPLPDIFAETEAVQPYLTTEDFSAGACELQPEEGPCVGGTGPRRLLRLTTLTPNFGEGNLYLGRPADAPELFTFSPCHGHYHFDAYAEYRLLKPDGTSVGLGGKRAFCLVDLINLASDEGPRFACSNDGSLEQGLQTGWADEYNGELPCQWVDVTDVPPGRYTLRITLNPDRVLAESDYSNNTTEIPVELTDP